jgi:hypothetical protein
LSLEEGDPIVLSTVTGSFRALGHDVTMQFSEFRFESHVYFAERPISRNVLGQSGWLDRLRIGIVHHDNLLYVARYDEPS